MSSEVSTIKITTRGTLYVGTSKEHDTNIIYRSTDEGNTWSVLTTLIDGKIFSIEVGKNGNIILGTSNGIYISSDGGNSWPQMNVGLK